MLEVEESGFPENIPPMEACVGGNDSRDARSQLARRGISAALRGVVLIVISLYLGYYFLNAGMSL
jgi:hypothetical protein